MTRQLPKPVAKVAAWVIFGTINGLIYSAGWTLMQWDDLRDGFRAYRRAQQLGREAEEYLRDGAR
ncbi:hypothetical protein [Mycolicibacterium fortuitum]